MPVKILLADKSITIQKVVEMLFSGKEYEVLCVSDGEAALSEAARINPDVVLADIDLPRVDGYMFSARLRQSASLTKTPVILMMSRDDVYDETKGRQAMITDHIAKPFESQELIGKVKKAVAGGPQKPAADGPAAAAAVTTPAPAAAPKADVPPAAPKSQATPTPPKPQPAPAAQARPAAPAPPAPPKPVKPQKETPADIFDIIEEAPSQAELKKTVPPAAEEEGVYEVEPVIEVEEELEEAKPAILPTGPKAVEEMRVGLGLTGKGSGTEDEIMSFESFDMGGAVREYRPKPEPEAREWKPPVAQPTLSESDLWSMAETVVSKIAKELFSTMPPAQAPGLPEQELRSMAEKTITAVAQEAVANMPPPQPPQISPDVIRSMVHESVAAVIRDVAREVVEKVAWEVIPEMAEMLIKAEIERLKAEP